MKARAIGLSEEREQDTTQEKIVYRKALKEMQTKWDERGMYLDTCGDRNHYVIHGRKRRIEINTGTRNIFKTLFTKYHYCK